MPWEEEPSSSRLRYYKQRLSESIKTIFFSTTARRRRRSRVSSGLSIRVPISPKVIEVHPVYSALQQILNTCLFNLCALDKELLRLDPTGARDATTDDDKILSLTTALAVKEPQTYGNCFEPALITDAQLAEKIRVLYILRRALAVFLSKCYTEIEEFGVTMPPDTTTTTTTTTDKPFGTLLINMHHHFSNLEQSIAGYSLDDNDSSSSSFKFDKLGEDYAEMWPDPSTWDFHWADCDTDKAVALIHDNLNKLDVYVSIMVSKYRKPSKITQHWMRYTFGAIGISIFSVWLIRSGIIDNLVLGAKKIFLEEQALTAARDEVLEMMRTREKEEIQQLKSTSSELHSMLLDVCERIKGEKSPSNVSDHEMLEVAMTSLEEQLRDPVQNFISGELPRLLHIHIQQMKLDLEASMCKVHHEMLLDYEATCAILSYMPIIYISFGVLLISRIWAKQAKAKGRISQVKRRLLLDELEERIREFENLSLSVERGHHLNGLLLFTLDRLYRVVERDAKAAGEWQWVRDDLTLLGDPGVETSDKLHVISDLNERYHCLQPLTRHELLMKKRITRERDLARKKFTNPSGMDNESITSDDSLWD